MNLQFRDKVKWLAAAKRKIEWCAKREKLNVDSVEVSDDFDGSRFRLTFRSGTKESLKQVPYAWVEDCSPEEDLVDGRIRGLLHDVRRELQ